MEERDERFDALRSEAAVLFYIWNRQITFSLESPGVALDRIGVRISQAGLAEDIGLELISLAALKRACDRLVAMGRLHRQRANSGDVYVYHVSEQACSEMLIDLVLRGGLLVRKDEHDRIIELEVVKPGNTKAAGESLSDFFNLSDENENES